jgi:hypothetical protein
MGIRTLDLINMGLNSTWMGDPPSSGSPGTPLSLRHNCKVTKINLVPWSVLVILQMGTKYLQAPSIKRNLEGTSHLDECMEYQATFKLLWKHRPLFHVTHHAFYECYLHCLKNFISVITLYCLAMLEKPKTEVHRH